MRPLVCYSRAGALQQAPEAEWEFLPYYLPAVRTTR